MGLHTSGYPAPKLLLDLFNASGRIRLIFILFWIVLDVLQQEVTEFSHLYTGYLFPKLCMGQDGPLGRRWHHALTSSLEEPCLLQVGNRSITVTTK